MEIHGWVTLTSMLMRVTYRSRRCAFIRGSVSATPTTASITGFERIYSREAQEVRHPFDHDLLFLDIDLTGLPAGSRARASTKGYMSGENTATAGSSPGLVPRNTMTA
jgi:hypothetical protein